MKLFILVLVFVTMLALASDDGEDDIETVDDTSVIITEPQKDKHDCVAVEVCDSEGNCDWRITCP